MQQNESAALLWLLVRILLFSSSPISGGIDAIALPDIVDCISGPLRASITAPFLTSYLPSSMSFAPLHLDALCSCPAPVLHLDLQSLL